MIAAIIGALATAAFGILAWFLARRRADKGLMPRMPANAFPAHVDMSRDLRPATRLKFVAAMTWWNRRLGNQTFLVVETMGLRVMVEPGQGDFALRTNFVDDQDIVLILVDEDARNLLRGVCHEFGHVLGLAHDPDDPGSVMYPTIPEGSFRVTDRDLKRVEERLWPSSHRRHI